MTTNKNNTASARPLYDQPVVTQEIGSASAMRQRMAGGLTMTLQLSPCPSGPRNLDLNRLVRPLCAAVHEFCERLSRIVHGHVDIKKNVSHTIHVECRAGRHLREVAHRLYASLHINDATPCRPNDQRIQCVEVVHQSSNWAGVQDLQLLHNCSTAGRVQHWCTHICNRLPQVHQLHAQGAFGPLRHCPSALNASLAPRFLRGESNIKRRNDGSSRCDRRSPCCGISRLEPWNLRKADHGTSTNRGRDTCNGERMEQQRLNEQARLHELPPLATETHSDTSLPRLSERITLATVKPPRDRRTRLREDV